jgi:hypothetical protein
MGKKTHGRIITLRIFLERSSSQIVYHDRTLTIVGL